MLVFVIAVKHPARSHSYERVTELLRQTVASIEAQTYHNFAIVVVSNVRPAWASPNERRLFVDVNFPPARLPVSLKDEHSWSYLDKGAKNAVGLLHARQFNPSHVMFVDADDFVSRRLAEHVRRNPTETGWYFDRGLMYSGQFKIAEVRDRFWTYCGSSHILKYDLLPVDIDLGSSTSFENIFNSLDQFYVERILGCHLDYASYVAKAGLRLTPLPFMGAVWHTETGENASRLYWDYSRFGSIWGKSLTLEQVQEFTIPPTQRTSKNTVLLYAWRARSLLTSAVRRALGRQETF